jgi:hypothetical protein
MLKFLLAALILAFPSALCAREDGNDAAGFVRRAGRNRSKPYDRQALTRAINETLVHVEDLSRRLKLASKDEIAEVWASAKRDFKLADSELSLGRKACESTMLALEHEAKATELDHAKAKAYRDEARDHVRSHHKRESEEYVQSFRNWLIINEGVLRKAQEKKDAQP